MVVGRKYSLGPSVTLVSTGSCISHHDDGSGVQGARISNLSVITNEFGHGDIHIDVNRNDAQSSASITTCPARCRCACWRLSRSLFRIHTYRLGKCPHHFGRVATSLTPPLLVRFYHSSEGPTFLIQPNQKTASVPWRSRHTLRDKTSVLHIYWYPPRSHHARSKSDFHSKVLLSRGRSNPQKLSNRQ